MRRNKLAENLTVAIVLVGAGAYAVARMDTDDARTLPYQGTLEQGGAAASGDYLMRFGLFPSAPTANDLACVQDDNCALWSEEQLVTVVNGRFSVLLGSSDGDLSDAILGNNTLHLGMAVKAAGDPGDFVLLDGSQEIVPTPWAARAAAARDFKVTGDLDVQGAAAVGGALVVDGTVQVGTGVAPVGLDVERGTMRIESYDNSTQEIARFFASNLTQGIAIGFNRIGTIGTNPSQDLQVVTRGDGELYVPALRNTNGNLTSYTRSASRYLVETPVETTGQTLGSTNIPESVLAERCGPPDGCTIRIGMRNYCTDFNNANCANSTSMGPFSFWYGELRSGRRAWRRSESITTVNPGQNLETAVGTDADATVTHVIRDHNCYFTDGVYTEGTTSSTDTAFGMSLLNWNNGYTSPVACWLTIDD